jgi:uncharacterized protein (TIGR03790 family)
MKRKIISFLIILVSVSTLSLADSNNVLIIVNDASPDSIEVGKYYQKKRNIPESNICHINTNSKSSISLKKYLEEVLKPIKGSLKTGIAYILMTYDTPYQLTIDKTYSLDSFLCFPYDSIPESFNKTYIGEINPYYNSGVHFNPNGKYFLVTRIDGQTPDIAKELVDRAIYGEQYISEKYGKCYFDARGLSAGSAYYNSDLDIIEAYSIVKSKGYDCILDKNSSEFTKGECPNALWYYGWYSYNNYNDAFTWKVGAVGIHLDSASALSIRGGPSWCSQALKRGITATVGAVNEPYASPYTRANLFFKYFLNGFNFAESSYMATPTSKWMMCMIGDPLYKPSDSFKKVDNVPPKILKVDYIKDEEHPDTAVSVVIETDEFTSVKLEYGDGNLKEDEVMKLKHNFDLWDLKPATTYDVKIVCIDSFDNTVIKEDKFTTSDVLPKGVEDLKAEEKDSEVRLIWSKSNEEDVVGYKIFKMLTAEKVPKLIATLPKDTTYYLDKDVINGKWYVYNVRTYNKKDILSPKAEVYVMPTELVPVEGIKVDIKDFGVVLSWNKVNSKEVGGYIVLRSKREKGEYKKIRKVFEEKFVDFNLKKGEIYYYKIITISKKGEEGKSTEPIEVKF